MKRKFIIASENPHAIYKKQRKDFQIKVSREKIVLTLAQYERIYKLDRRINSDGKREVFGSSKGMPARWHTEGQSLKII